MAPENEMVEDVEHVSIEPAEGADDAEETDTEGEADTEEGEAEAAGGEGETPAAPQKREIVTNTPAATAPAAAAATGDGNDIQRLEGETPREFAMRQELTKTRGLLRTQRSQEILGTESAAPVKPATTVNNEVLAKYKPEEIKALGEVAEALGFVKADQLGAQTYTEKGQAYLDNFLDKHPEYSPEKDKDGKLWDAFKSEFAMYKQPQDPKDFTRIFNRVHATVFGIQPQGAGGKQAAAAEKVTVASRGSAPAPVTRTAVPQRNTGGVRKDMLKGFSEEEMKEMGIE